MHRDERAEAWLRRYHDEKPGCTRRAFIDMPGDDGRSSYQRLADAARAEGPGGAVLDLACGDGTLLALLAGETGGLTGLDMSEGELSSARTRLGGRAVLTRGRAQAMPYPDDQFDVVTCHMALMLMRPVAPALSEVRRVLRPGGVFAMILPTGEREGAWAALVERLLALPFLDDCPSFGDRRVYREDGLGALLAGAGFARQEQERFTVRRTASTSELLDFFLDSYDVDRLTPGALAALEAHVHGMRYGDAPFGFGLKLVTAR